MKVRSPPEPPGRARAPSSGSPASARTNVAAPSEAAKSGAPARTSDADDTGAADEARKDLVSDFVKGSDEKAPPQAMSPLQTRLALASSTDTGRAAAAVAAAGGDLYSETVYTTPPGAVGAAVVDEEKVELSHTGALSANIEVGLGDVDGDGVVDRETSLRATMDRAALGVTAETELADGSAVGGGITRRRNLYVVHGHTKWADDDGKVSQASAFGAFNKNELVVGGSYTFGGGTLTPTVGGVALTFFDREVKDLGNATGGPLDGKRRVELRRVKKLGAVGYLGSMATTLGVGARLLPLKGQEVVYRTHLDRDEAKAFVFEDTGAPVQRYAKDLLRAAEIASDKIEVPDPADLERLKVGDELIVRTEGKVIGSFVVGAAAMQAGVYGTLSGEFEVAVRRVSETEIDLCVTPTQADAVQLSAHAPLVLDALKARHNARSLRQGFRFDLSQPGAKEAYLKALAGELPHGDKSARRAMKDAPAGDDALVKFIESEALAPGVSRTYLERVDVQLDRAAVGLSLGPLQSFMGDSIAGLSRETNRVRETRRLAVGNAVLETSTRGVERRRQVLLSGRESAGAFATLRRQSSYAESGEKTQSFDGLELSLRFSDDRVRGLELNSDVLSPVRELLGVELRDFSVEGNKKRHAVDARFSLSAADLEALSRVSEERSREVAQDVDVPPRKLNAALERLRAAPDPSARAETVQELIRDAGLAGVGAVFRLLDQPERLALAAHSTAYTGPAKALDELRLRFSTPIDGAASKKDLTARFKEAHKIQADVDAGLRLLEDDPLIDDKAPLRDALEQTAAGLTELCSLAHLSLDDKKALHERLDRGWTTSLQGQIMALLAGKA